MSNKVYLADKETLDSVKTTVENVNSDVSSVSAKVSAVDTNVTAISTNVTVVSTKVDSVASQTGATGDNVIAMASKLNTVESLAGEARDAAESATNYSLMAADAVRNPAGIAGDAVGTMHDKIAYIVNYIANNAGYPTAPVEVDCPEQMILVTGDSRNEITVTPNNGKWCEGAINIEEPGLVHAVYINNPLDFTKNVRLIIDGRTYELGKTQNSSMNYIAQFMDGTIGYTSSPSGGIPIRFKDGFRVDVETNGAGNTMPTLRMGYETYKTISGGV